MSILGTIGTISLIFLFFILGKLSERFGSVVRMSPLYRYYYLALILALISAAVQILVVRQTSSTPTDIPLWVTSAWFILLAYHLPLAIAVTIGIYVTWHYWSWLITERNE
jgi:hypothetical protein